VIFAAGIVWWIAAMHTHPDYLNMLPGMLITGIGVGLTLPTLIATAVSSLPPASFSTGSAVVTMARQIGSVLGVAILVAIVDTARRTSSPVTIFDRGWWFTAATAGLAAFASLTLALTRTSAPSPASTSARETNPLHAGAPQPRENT
jgi:hypothetical protein